jgi:hypothetical protein
MEASRTHQVTHGQSLWSWVLIGAVGLIVTAAIVLAVQANSGGEYVTVRAPAEAQAEVQAPAPVGGTLDGDVLHGRGLVDVKVGATTFTAPPTAIREGGVYVEAQEATPIPRRGNCATKQGC